MNSEISYPNLNIDNCFLERQNVRSSQWEVDFEKNHKIFAENLATGIAKAVLNEYAEIFKNPYKLSLSDIEYYKDISLEIVEPKVAQEMLTYMGNNSELSPPFGGWLKKFSGAEDLEEIDEDYFKGFMEKVGVIATSKLEELFSKHVESPKGVQFKAELHNSASYVMNKLSLFVRIYVREEKSSKKIKGDDPCRTTMLCVAITALFLFGININVLPLS